MTPAKAAADLCRRLRNPAWPESIPLSALEAMEQAARMIEAGLKPGPAKPGPFNPKAAAALAAPPLWYVARYGDSSFGIDVEFFDSPLTYGNACRRAEREHDSGDCDSYTMGRALGPAAEALALWKSQAKTARTIANIQQAAADQHKDS